MIAKEWRDARWKLLLGVLAFLVLLPLTIRSYEAIQEDIAFQLKMMQGDMQEPETFAGPMSEAESKEYIADTREQLRDMQSPGFAEEVAYSELSDTTTYLNLLVLVSLAGLLGVGLISSEVSGGSILLLLSKPLSRGRIMMTKYTVCAACLLVVAVFGGISAILYAYARGYPSQSVQVTQILTSTTLIWLASLFVLGVALIASIIFRDVVVTLVATVAAMFVILAGPELLRALAEWIIWGDRIYQMDLRTMPSWYKAFDYFQLTTYWTGFGPYSGQTLFAQSFVVCLVTALATLLLALWLFRRKTY